MFKRKKLVIVAVLAVLLVGAGAYWWQFMRIPAGVVLNEDLPPAPDSFDHVKVTDYARDGLSDEKIEEYRLNLEEMIEEVKTRPDSLQNWMRLGLAKKRLGDFEGARDAWEYGSLIRPKNTASFSNLGDLYWNFLENYPASEHNYLRVTENDPTRVDAYRNLVQLYQFSWPEKEHFVDDVLLKGLEKNPKSVDLNVLLGEYFAGEGETAKAREYYQNALSLARQEPDSEGLIEAIQEEINRL